MATVTEVRKRLKWMKGQHVAVAIWCEDDVIEYARERRELEITREQARQVIDTIDRKQDSELGISSDTLDCYLDELVDPNKCPACLVPKSMCVCVPVEDA